MCRLVELAKIAPKSTSPDGNLMRLRNWGCDPCSDAATRQPEPLALAPRHTYIDAVHAGNTASILLRLRSNLTYICSDLMKCISVLMLST